MLMLADLMGSSKITKINPKRESAQLYLGELTQLAEELSHRNSVFRSDGREILDAILTHMESYCTDEDVSSTLSAQEKQRVFAEARRELQANWIRVDTLIDDLLGSAVDELAQFAFMAEVRIRSYERVLHRGETNKSQDDGPGAT